MTHESEAGRPTVTTGRRRIADIRVHRSFRQDLGHLDGLAQSIRAHGLLHPIVADQHGTLIAGLRRLRACESLGWPEIPVHVVDLEDPLRAMNDENVVRKPWLPTEAVAIGRAIEDYERGEAKERQGTRTDQHSGKLPESSRGDSRDRISSTVGMSGRTWEKAKEVVEAARNEPEKYGELVEEMDRTRRVAGVHKKLVVARKEEAIQREIPALPPNKYHVIVVDPPWTFSNRASDPSHRGTNPYPSMSIDAINTFEVKGRTVQDLALDDCSLWLWTTNSHLRQAFDVMEAWGFTYKTMMTWGKNKIGLGDYLRGQTEHCLVGVRGRPVFNTRGASTLLLAKAGEHSAKPAEFYQLVESVCAGKKAELFQRQGREGWIGHGDEAGKW